MESKPRLVPLTPEEEATIDIPDPVIPLGSLVRVHGDTDAPEYMGTWDGVIVVVVGHGGKYSIPRSFMSKSPAEQQREIIRLISSGIVPDPVILCTLKLPDTQDDGLFHRNFRPDQLTVVGQLADWDEYVPDEAWGVDGADA